MRMTKISFLYLLAYSCYGSWEENGTFYLIASPISRKSTEARRYCFISTPIYENNEQSPNSKDLAVSDHNIKRNVVKLMLSTVAESCFRTIRPGINGIKAFNFTIIGKYIYFYFFFFIIIFSSLVVLI